MLKLLIIGGPDVDKRLEMMDLLRSEFDCTAAGSSPELKKNFETRGFAYYNYELFRKFNPLADLRSIWQLFSIIMKLRPDIVHCFDTKPCLVGRIAAFLARVPKIIGTLPGLGALYTYSIPAIRRQRAIFRHYHKLSCRLSDMTIFQNSDDRLTFIEEGIVTSRKSLLIHGSGVSRDRFETSALPKVKSGARARLGISDQSKVITMVSRLIRSKGVLDFAQASVLLRAQKTSCRFLIAGPVETEVFDSLQPEELDMLKTNLEWLGEYTNIPELLAASDIFVFPSYYREGIPRVLVEAAFAGVPVITTDNVGCHEVIKHGSSGLLVRPRQPADLKESILRLLDDQEYARELATVARENALQRFELKPIVQKHRRLYRS